MSQKYKMHNFKKIEDIATHLRDTLDNQKKYVLIYAYNGTGKTRLSGAFRDIGKQSTTDNNQRRDTLYFNAFTEDLFSWDNDLEGDNERFLKLNIHSQFFNALIGLEMDNRIRPLLNRYADYDFRIETTLNDLGNLTKAVVRFSRKLRVEEKTITQDDIKISRGEENIFIWCFFLAILEIAMDKDIDAYNWVRYVYIDDPISSLDENNAIAVAHHLAQILKSEDNKMKIVISSHHSLFFNVCCNELDNGQRYFLSKTDDGYALKDTSKNPFFYHVSLLKELHKAAQSKKLYTYHFSMLRVVLEKAASFHGFNSWSNCIKQDADDPDGILYARLINILNHGNYSLYEPQEMLPENQDYFEKILNNFLNNYKFNEELFLLTENSTSDSEKANS